MGRYTKAEILARTLPIALPTLMWTVIGGWRATTMIPYFGFDPWFIALFAGPALLGGAVGVGAARLAWLRKTSWLGYLGFVLLGIATAVCVGCLTENLWVSSDMLHGTEDWPREWVVAFCAITAGFVGLTSAAASMLFGYVGVWIEERGAGRRGSGWAQGDNDKYGVIGDA